MSGSFFYKLGRAVRKKTGRGRLLWHAMTGSEADAIRAEREYGQDLADAVVQEMRIDARPADTRLLGEIGSRLADRLRDQRRRFDFHVVDGGPDVTAFALPGGFVFFSSSLLDLCGREPDEVAFVLGHEMGHVVRGHAVERIMNRWAIDVAARVAPVRGQLGRWIKQVGVKYLETAYSREQEFDADRFGIRLARAAGFDAGGGVRLLRRLAAADGDDGIGLAAYFSTHPPIAERVRHALGDGVGHGDA